MRIARLACALILLSGAAFYDLDGARAQGGDSDAARQACTPDAMRLCSDFIPDVAKVTACMKAKSAQLSEPCRIAIRGGGARHGERHTERHHRVRHCRHHCG